VQKAAQADAENSAPAGSLSLERRWQLRTLPKLTAATLDHTVFLNRGDRFEPRAMPREAQVAPAFGVNVADFDGDGHDDVFIAQNFFTVTSDGTVR
jgi:hypothetical protein